MLAGLKHYKSDVWSLGVILFELAAQELPFSGNGSVDILNNQRKPFPAYLDYQFVTVVKRMLRKNPNNRPSFLDILRLGVLQKRPELSGKDLAALIDVQESSDLIAEGFESVSPGKEQLDRYGKIAILSQSDWHKLYGSDLEEVDVRDVYQGEQTEVAHVNQELPTDRPNER